MIKNPADVGSRGDAAATGAPGTDSTAYQYLKQIVNELNIGESSLIYQGTITAVVAGASLTIDSLKDKGTNYFVPTAGTAWYLYVVEADGAAPAGEMQVATGYTTATGLFAYGGAFTAEPAVGDQVMLIHPVLGSLGIASTAAATGAVTTTDLMMAYMKQLVTNQLATVHGPMDFWSDLDDNIAVDAAAGDENLPNVVVADLPTGATVVRAIMMFKYSKRVDSSSAANYTEDAQVMSIDSSGARDSVVTAINIPDDSFHTAADATEGGDVIIGDNDVAAEVIGNATYYPTWELADAHGASLTFYDVQVGLRIWYTVE